jgi:hypothetical protein
MSSSNSSIKVHCEEFINTNLNEEQSLKVLNKFLRYLKLLTLFYINYIFT